jgi:hypothetical protein
MDTAIAIVVVVVVVVAVYYFLKPQGPSDVKIISDITDGRKEKHQKVEQSVGQSGIEFSYDGWLRIDDFTYKYGTEKVIFVKGSADLSTACPALLIDANTNSLLVKMDTFGSQETISIVSVPARKWLHFAITVNQEMIDVYINGILYAHHTLTQLPRQNSGSVLTSPNGGFAGKVVLVQYHPRTLSASDVQSMASAQPPTGSEKNQVFPPYFGLSWFTDSR